MVRILRDIHATTASSAITITKLFDIFASLREIKLAATSQNGSGGDAACDVSISDLIGILERRYGIVIGNGSGGSTRESDLVYYDAQRMEELEERMKRDTHELSREITRFSFLCFLFLLCLSLISFYLFFLSILFYFKIECAL